MRRLALFVVIAAVLVMPALAVAAASRVSVSPQRLNFGTKTVGTETFKTVTVTNTSGTDLLVAMTGGPPGDFGWGPVDIAQNLCVFSGGDILAPGESCQAFVRFSPTEFFAGWRQTGTLQVAVSDPSTLKVLETRVVSVT